MVTGVVHDNIGTSNLRFRSQSGTTLFSDMHTIKLAPDQSGSSKHLYCSTGSVTFNNSTSEDGKGLIPSNLYTDFTNIQLKTLIKY